MERIMTALEGHVAYPQLPRVVSPPLRDAGFEIGQRSVFTLFDASLDEDTSGHGLINAIAEFAVGRQRVTRDGVIEWELDLAALGAADRYFFSLNHYLFLATKPLLPASQ